MSKGKVYVTIGTIASGKTTFTKKVAKDLKAIIINDDAIVMALHGNNYLAYDESNKTLYKTIENNIMMHALALGRDVIYDMPNMSRARRKRPIGIAKAMDAKVIAVQFPLKTAEEHAQRRFRSDNRGRTEEDWLKVAQRHIDEYEAPTFEEGFDDIRIIPESVL